MAERRQRLQLRPPAAALGWLEARAVLEAGSLIPAAPWLAGRPRGDGHRVMVIPGYATDDRVTWPLRCYLGYLGYAVEGWGQGRNRGFPEEDAERLVDRLRRDGVDSPMTLVGWSLGGVIARLVARAEPSWVRQIVTMGTPVEGGPRYTAAGPRIAAEQGLDLDAFEAHVHAINAEGLDVPITVLYSRWDGVVGWSAAVDRYNPHARHVRLRGASHVGLAYNPRVWAEVAHACARPLENA